MDRMMQKVWPIYNADGTCLIPLAGEKFAIVDEPDLENLLHCRWYASRQSAYSNTEYAKGFATGEKTPKYMHRVILNFPVLCIDHINGNGLDNRRCNLRLCTKRENGFNMPFRKTNTSGFRGVHQQAGKWYASIRFRRKLYALGSYSAATDAAAAYDVASLLLHGKFGNRNNVEVSESVRRFVELKLNGAA